MGYFYVEINLLTSKTDTIMQSVGFSYNGKMYTGSLLSNPSEVPEFYWCFFDNNDLINEVGECVSFIKNKENLQTTRPYNEKYQILIDSIKAAIMPYIKRD
jgi:hypothetical protein